MGFGISLIVLFYLIGSLPTAYLYMKLLRSRNILQEGSGNAGAMNVYDVTQSKADGIAVLFMDLLKGFIPAFLYLHVFKIDGFSFSVLAGALVMGHNFPVWTKFKGGRGLSSAAGILLAADPALVGIWLAVYFATRLLVNNVHFASAVALVAVPATFFSDFILRNIIAPVSFMKSIYSPQDALFLTTLSVCAAAMTKHVVPVYKFITTKKS
ncbi:MAG: glycerol-3-phosphate acyltransferase [Ignavibacteria bacterium]|nr:glycerol-3-phosphate acyltransferase [Ignavibacteria bacterium]